MIYSTAKLIKETYEKDGIGQMIATEEEKEIFVTEQSISRAEWSAAQSIGLNPSVTLTTPSVNYEGQKVVDYNGLRYAIYRTETYDGQTRLYLEERAGVMQE